MVVQADLLVLGLMYFFWHPCRDGHMLGVLQILSLTESQKARNVGSSEWVCVGVILCVYMLGKIRDAKMTAPNTTVGDD